MNSPFIYLGIISTSNIYILSFIEAHQCLPCEREQVNGENNWTTQIVLSPRIIMTAQWNYCLLIFIVSCRLTPKSNGSKCSFCVHIRSVANVLRSNGKAESQYFECVTVYFSDIVGFGSISSELNPHQVCDLLNALYKWVYLFISIFWIVCLSKLVLFTRRH